jgi:hypothetical protein
MLIVGAICLTGVVPIAYAYGDEFVTLDGGWRILNGQIPHVDFYSALGPVSYLLAAAGLKVAEYSPDGLAYATAAMGFILGMWAYLVARKRMLGFLATVVAIAITLIATGPHLIDTRYDLFSYAAQYNRYGYALLGIVILECLQGSAEESGVSAFAAIGTGVACGILLLLKANYFFVSVAILLASFLLRRQGAAAWMGRGFGFVLVIITAAIYFRLSVIPFFSDQEAAAITKGSSFAGTRLLKCAKDLIADSVPVIAFAMVACLAPRPSCARRLYSVLVGAVIIVAGFIILISNSQYYGGAPLNLIYLAIVMNQFSQHYVNSNMDERKKLFPVTVCVVLLGLGVVVPPLLTEGIALTETWKAKHYPSQETSQKPSTVVVGGAVGRIEYVGEAISYGNHVNAGIELLKRESEASDRVLCLCYANPFPYALQRRPPTGGSTAYDFGITYSAIAPLRHKLFGSADVIMVSKDPFDAQPVLVNLVRRELEGDFGRTAESVDWILYKRLK